MKMDRLTALLRGIRGKKILVFGDYFLDKYLVIDPELEEVSLETGRPAHQIVSVRSSPGGAGTVTSNLAALGARTFALGLIGRDGEGWDLIEGLRRRGVGTDWLLETDGHPTGTYIKPMRRLPRQEVETERLDVRRRERLDRRTEQALVMRLRRAQAQVNATVVVDAVPDDCGVVSKSILSEIARTGKKHLVLVDSRRRIGQFRDVIVKPNLQEGAAAIGESKPRRIQRRWIERVVGKLYRLTRRPVFLTAEADGIYVFDGEDFSHLAALPPRGPIDTVGAGDCVAAALTASLCAGATAVEAAQIANLAASVTIHKLGTTGTASPEEILELAAKVADRLTG